jgi:hypothetical protein
MTNEQKRRLQEAIDKYNETTQNRLSWWEVEKMIGDINNRMRIETTIKAIKDMTKK